MTDRFNAFIVVLEEDMREDDAQATIKAIEQIRGVLRVTANVASMTDHIAEMRVRQELHEKLFAVVYPKGAKK